MVILLDETTASLDVDNETEIQKAISKLVKQQNASTEWKLNIRGK